MVNTRSTTRLNTRRKKYTKKYIYAPPKKSELLKDLEKFRRIVKSKKRTLKLHPLYSLYEPDSFFQFNYNNIPTRKILPRIVPVEREPYF